MELHERFDVSPAKLAALRQRIERLGVVLAAVEEGYSRGGGKGGQKLNKTSNKVTLRYPPLGLVIQCQRDRRRSVNRFLALRELVDRIEREVSPETSPRLREIEEARRRKSRRSARARRKYAPAGPQARP
ncbi:MAG: peptide chain release factor-like protein [Elusimicrobia bacterium]|nr:peptide chain release factor-like protein [Elusimicrobiota bacterium]